MDLFATPSPSVLGNPPHPPDQIASLQSTLTTAAGSLTPPHSSMRIDRTPMAAGVLALSAIGALVVLRVVFRGALD